MGTLSNDEIPERRIKAKVRNNILGLSRKTLINFI
jgi:hypothetical protein